MSNALGIVNPIEEIISKTRKNSDACIVIDGAQSAPHFAIDVQKMDCDFFAFSGHKMYAPMGVGILYGKEEILRKIQPFHGGGEMIATCSFDGTTYADLPFKFEAGTPNVEGAVSLAAAIKYLKNIGFEEIEAHEKKLVTLAIEGMKKIPHVRIIGSDNPADKTGLVAFTVDDVHPHDVSEILSSQGICIRTGHHCAQPLHIYLDVNATCRASFYFYNTEEEVAYFLDKLSKVRAAMGYKD